VEVIGRTSVRAGADISAGAGLAAAVAGGFGAEDCGELGDGVVGIAGDIAGFGACDICSGICAFADGVSGLRSVGAALGVTITEGGLKLDGIGSGRLGMNTGADSFSAGGFGGGATGADAFEAFAAAGIAGSRGGIAGTNGSATCAA
jgi:hypothetical protein